MVYRPYKTVDVKLTSGAKRRAQLFPNNVARLNIQLGGKLKAVKGEIIDGNFYPLDAKYDDYMKSYKRQRTPIYADSASEYQKIGRTRFMSKFNGFDFNVETDVGIRRVHGNFVTISGQKRRVKPDFENKKFVLTGE